jgi:RNA polymerase sigma factor (sigma-70 family)
VEPRLLKTSQRSSSARARVWRLQPDAALCQAAANGNELAFSELYLRHYRALQAFVFHLMGARHRHEDAEDVVQDAFLRALDAIAEHRFSGDFKRWVFTIARNRSIDLLRGERVGMVSLESAGIELKTPLGATTPAAAVETREEVNWLVTAIQQLPERQRSALLLRELAGLSHEAIADELATTPASARQLITRARDGVRDAAERDGLEKAPRSSRTLRRELLDSAPILPLAAAGIVVSAGAATGGSLVVGKLVATALAVILFAGAAGTVNHAVDDASGAPSNVRPSVTASVPEKRSADPARDQRKARHEARVRLDSRDGAETPIAKSAPKKTTVEPQPTHSAAPEVVSKAETPKLNSPQVAKPVKEVVQLPNSVVEHTTELLNGSSSVGSTVGDVLTDVTETVKHVVKGVVAPAAN